MGGRLVPCRGDPEGEIRLPHRNAPREGLRGLAWHHPGRRQSQMARGVQDLREPGCDRVVHYRRGEPQRARVAGRSVPLVREPAQDGPLSGAGRLALSVSGHSRVPPAAVRSLLNRRHTECPGYLRSNNEDVRGLRADTRLPRSFAAEETSSITQFGSPGPSISPIHVAGSPTAITGWWAGKDHCH